METLDKVKEVIIDSLGCDESKITMEAKIVEDLECDSLSMVELVMALEDAFGISVPEEVSKEIKTVGDIVTLVQKSA